MTGSSDSDFIYQASRLRWSVYFGDVEEDLSSRLSASSRTRILAYVHSSYEKGAWLYYECAGRCTEDLPDSRGFCQLWTCLLDGQVLRLAKMRPSLSLYIQKTNQEKFRKEIEMATKTTLKRKSRHQWTENYLKERSREVWTRFGELNSLLKVKKPSDLNPTWIEQLQTELRGYYYITATEPISASMQKARAHWTRYSLKGGSMDKSQLLLLKNNLATQKGGMARPTKLKSTQKDRVTLLCR